MEYEKKYDLKLFKAASKVTSFESDNKKRKKDLGIPSQWGEEEPEEDEILSQEISEGEEMLTEEDYHEEGLMTNKEHECCLLNASSANPQDNSKNLNSTHKEMGEPLEMTDTYPWDPKKYHKNLRLLGVHA